MRICSKCHKAKELTEFYLRKKGPRAGEHYSHCKDCLRTRGKSYYRSNHIRQLALANQRNRSRRRELRKYVNSLKNRPCVDCGNSYSTYVMDFDHRKGYRKKGNIGTLVNQSNLSKENILDEINKCDLVCANCHRIRTYKRKSLE